MALRDDSAGNSSAQLNGHADTSLCSQNQPAQCRDTQHSRASTAEKHRSTATTTAANAAGPSHLVVAPKGNMASCSTTSATSPAARACRGGESVDTTSLQLPPLILSPNCRTLVTPSPCRGDLRIPPLVSRWGRGSRNVPVFGSRRCQPLGPRRFSPLST